METIIRLKASEIDISFLNKLKILLESNDDIEITINPKRQYEDSFCFESPVEMRSRIDNSIEEAEKGLNLISFSKAEFDIFCKSRLK